MPSPARTAHITHLARYVISTCMRKSWKITICNFNYSSTQNSRSHIRLLHSLILSAHKYNNGTRWNNCLLLAFQRWFSSSLLPADRYRHLTECIAVCLYGRIPLLLPRQIWQIKRTRLPVHIKYDIKRIICRSIILLPVIPVQKHCQHSAVIRKSAFHACVP